MLVSVPARAQDLPPAAIAQALAAKLSQEVQTEIQLQAIIIQLEAQIKDLQSKCKK
jgi:hypothetical protein